MAALGLTPDDYDEEVFEIWPENLPIYRLWHRVGDQWRMGQGGPVALDLVPVFHELDRMGLEGEDYDDWVDGMKAVAAGALLQIAKSTD